MIELCTICYNFQRRWFLQLQSIVEQVDPPPMVINVAYCKDNGNPTTDTLINHFSNRGLLFNRVEYQSYEQMPNQRGYIRNDQITASSGEYLFFIDCDIVYHPRFFNILATKIDPQFNGIYCPENFYVTNVLETEQFINSPNLFNIEDAYRVAERLPKLLKHPRGVAVGGAQLIKRESIFKYNNGLYSKRNSDRRLGTIGTRSDINFRHNIQNGCHSESIQIKRIPIQIHLDHYRSVDPGYDINYQR